MSSIRAALVSPRERTDALLAHGLSARVESVLVRQPLRVVRLHEHMVPRTQYVRLHHSSGRPQRPSFARASRTTTRLSFPSSMVVGSFPSLPSHDASTVTPPGPTRLYRRTPCSSVNGSTRSVDPCEVPGSDARGGRHDQSREACGLPIRVKNRDLQLPSLWFAQFYVFGCPGADVNTSSQRDEHRIDKCERQVRVSIAGPREDGSTVGISQHGRSVELHACARSNTPVVEQRANSDRRLRKFASVAASDIDEAATGLFRCLRVRTPSLRRQSQRPTQVRGYRNWKTSHEHAVGLRDLNVIR